MSRAPLWRQAYSEQRAASYEQLLKRGAGPVYERLLEALVESYGLLAKGARPRVLDLGAGTGNVAARLLERLQPGAVVCLDGSTAMLDRAKARLGRDARVSFVERNFGRRGWRDGLGAFDAVVSVGAIHHLTGPSKRRLFGEVRAALKPRGVFLCGDPVAGSSRALSAVYENAWVRLIKANLTAAGEADVPLEAIRAEHRRIQRAEGDKPSPLEEQLDWLRGSGFKRADCFWKHFGFAVYGGCRP